MSWKDRKILARKLKIYLHGCATNIIFLSPAGIATYKIEQFIHGQINMQFGSNLRRILSRGAEEAK